MTPCGITVDAMLDGGSPIMTDDVARTAIERSGCGTEVSWGVSSGWQAPVSGQPECELTVTAA